MDTAPDYGIWVDVSEAAADARALAGAPPDIVVRTAGHTTGSDAVRIAASYTGGVAAITREVSTRAKGTP